jgi:hypothetical protein
MQCGEQPALFPAATASVVNGTGGGLPLAKGAHGRKVYFVKQLQIHENGANDNSLVPRGGIAYFQAVPAAVPSASSAPIRGQHPLHRFLVHACGYQFSLPTARAIVARLSPHLFTPVRP